MTTTLLQPGQIEAPACSIPEFPLPPADLFLTRARRLEQLAEGHTMAELSADAKNAISHRGEAMRTALQVLRAAIAGRVESEVPCWRLQRTTTNLRSRPSSDPSRIGSATR